MWYLFPQIKSLEQSDTAKVYFIEDINEATAYLHHPILGMHLIEISQIVLQPEGKTANQIVGSPDDLNLCSSTTWFANVEGAYPVFQQVTDAFFYRIQDQETLDL